MDESRTKRTHADAFYTLADDTAPQRKKQRLIFSAFKGAPMEIAPANLVDSHEWTKHVNVAADFESTCQPLTLKSEMDMVENYVKMWSLADDAGVTIHTGAFFYHDLRGIRSSIVTSEEKMLVLVFDEGLLILRLFPENTDPETLPHPRAQDNVVFVPMPEQHSIRVVDGVLVENSILLVLKDRLIRTSFLGTEAQVLFAPIPEINLLTMSLCSNAVHRDTLVVSDRMHWIIVLQLAADPGAPVAMTALAIASIDDTTVCPPLTPIDHACWLPVALQKANNTIALDWLAASLEELDLSDIITLTISEKHLGIGFAERGLMLISRQEAPPVFIPNSQDCAVHLLAPNSFLLAHLLPQGCQIKEVIISDYGEVLETNAIIQMDFIFASIHFSARGTDRTQVLKFVLHPEDGAPVEFASILVLHRSMAMVS